MSLNCLCWQQWSCLLCHIIVVCQTAISTTTHTCSLLLSLTDTHTHTYTLYHRLPSKMKKLKAKTGWAGLISPHSFAVFAYTHIHAHTHPAPVVFVGISCCRSVPLLTFLRFSTIFTAVIVIIFVVVIVFTPFLIKLKFS